MALFGVKERFYEGTTYYEDQTYQLSEEKVAQFKKSGQAKRLIAMDEEAQAMLADFDAQAAATTGAKGDAAVVLDDMSKAELLEYAAAQGVTVASNANKASIIEAIQAAQAAATTEA